MHCVEYSCTLCCIRYGIYPVLHVCVCALPSLPAAFVGFKLDSSIRKGGGGGGGGRVIR